MFAGALPFAFLKIFDDPVILLVKIEEDQADHADCAGNDRHPDIGPAKRGDRGCALGRCGEFTISSAILQYVQHRTVYDGRQRICHQEETS